MKGQILPDHIPTNKYELVITGLPPVTPVEVGGIEDEVQTTELPDRTRASGGNRGPTEFTIAIPAHHSVEIAAMEIWFREGQDPVLPTYKKPGILLFKSISGDNTPGFTLVGAFVSKRETPDLEMAAEGEQVNWTYTISVDDLIPI